MKKTAIISIMGILLIIATPVDAELVDLDLLALGCPQEFPGTWTYWESDFDLEVTFSNISHVYIDWAGEITAGLFQMTDPDTFEPIGDPIIAEEGIYVSLGFNPNLRKEILWGGDLTYPAPEPFDTLTEITLPSATTWSDLLDGQGNVKIGYYTVIGMNGHYVERGNIVLNDATLIIDGTVVPEPTAILFLSIGICGVRLRGQGRKNTLYST